MSLGLYTATVLFACVLLASILTACSTGEDQSWEVQDVRACSTGEERDCIDLLVEIDKHFYSQGEPITVTARTVAYDIYGPGVTTISQGFAPVREREYAGRSFEFVLVDELGRAAHLTEEGIEMQLEGATRLSVRFDHNSPRPESFRIDTWFDLSEPGTYTLTLKQYLTFPERYTPCNDIETQEIEIVGNLVTFTRLP